MRSKTIFAAVGGVALGVVSGVGVAAVMGWGEPSQAQASGFSSEVAADPPRLDVYDNSGEAIATRDFPINSYGQTYGTESMAKSIEEMPDLIAVWVDEDTVGYVPREVLYPISDADDRSLEASGQRVNNVVTAYESDGETTIGEVQLGTDGPSSEDS